MECDGSFDPPSRFVWHERDHAVSDRVGELPVVAAGVNLKAGNQDFRMKTPFEADFLQLFVRLLMVAQFQPALRGFQVMAVRGWYIFHALVLIRTALQRYWDSCACVAPQFY